MASEAGDVDIQGGAGEGGCPTTPGRSIFGPAEMDSRAVSMPCFRRNVLRSVSCSWQRSLRGWRAKGQRAIVNISHMAGRHRPRGRGVRATKASARVDDAGLSGGIHSQRVRVNSGCGGPCIPEDPSVIDRATGSTTPSRARVSARRSPKLSSFLASPQPRATSTARASGGRRPPAISPVAQERHGLRIVVA